jgi:hypothetical protein
MRVTPVHATPVDITARDARIKAQRALNSATIDASHIIGVKVSAPIDGDPRDYRQGVVVSVDPANASSANVRATLADGSVVLIPKSAIPGASDQVTG